MEYRTITTKEELEAFIGKNRAVAFVFDARSAEDAWSAQVAKIHGIALAISGGVAYVALYGEHSSLWHLLDVQLFDVSYYTKITHNWADAVGFLMKNRVRIVRPIFDTMVIQVPGLELPERNDSPVGRDEDETRQIQVCHSAKMTLEKYVECKALLEEHPVHALDAHFSCAVFCGLMQYFGIPVCNSFSLASADKRFYRQWWPISEGNALFSGPCPKGGTPPDEQVHAYGRLLLKVRFAGYRGDVPQAIERLTWNKLLHSGDYFRPVMLDGDALVFEIDDDDQLKDALIAIHDAFEFGTDHMDFSAGRRMSELNHLIPIFIEAL